MIDSQVLKFLTELEPCMIDNKLKCVYNYLDEKDRKDYFEDYPEHSQKYYLYYKIIGINMKN